MSAEPEWYALLLTKSLIGTRPLPTTISAEGSPNLVAAGFSGPNHSLEFVLADNEPPGATPLGLSLGVGAGMSTAQIQRLTAPSQSATSGVQLAYRAVAANGSWRAPAQIESVSASSGTVALELAPSSAVLVTVSPPKPPKPPKPAHKHAHRKPHRSG